MFTIEFSSVSGQVEQIMRTTVLNPFVRFLVMLLIATSLMTEKTVTGLSTGLGFDSIHSNHLQFASQALNEILAQFFNSWSHSWKMLKWVIVPTVKDRFGNKSRADNFREIMNSFRFFLSLWVLHITHFKNLYSDKTTAVWLPAQYINTLSHRHF